MAVLFGRSFWITICSLAISQVSSQHWQRFRNGQHVPRNRNAFMQALRSNTWPVSIEPNAAGNREANFENDEFDSNNLEVDGIEFDDPSVGLVELLDDFFEEDDPEITDFGNPSLSFGEDSLQIRSQAGDIKLDLGGDIDLSDVAFNEKLEHELLFGDAFKNVRARTGTIVTSPGSQITNQPIDLKDLAQQIRLSIQQRQPQSDPNRRQTLGPTSRAQSHDQQRISPLPQQPRLMNNNFQGGSHTRNMSANGMFPQYPILLLINSSSINNARNNFNQRRTVVRGPDTDILSERTVSVERGGNNQHIGRSDFSISTTNSSRSFSSTNINLNDIPNALNLRLQGLSFSGNNHNAIHQDAQRPTNGNNIHQQQRRINNHELRPQGSMQNLPEPNNIPNFRLTQHIESPQGRNPNAQDFRPMNGINSRPHGNNIANPVVMANEQRKQRQMIPMPNIVTNGNIRGRHIPNSNQLNMNNPAPNFRTLDTPGITRQQQIAQQTAIQRNMLAQRHFTQRQLQQEFIHNLRNQMPPPFYNGHFPFHQMEGPAFPQFEGPRFLGQPPLQIHRPPFFL